MYIYRFSELIVPQCTLYFRMQNSKSSKIMALKPCMMIHWWDRRVCHNRFCFPECSGWKLWHQSWSLIWAMLSINLLGINYVLFILMDYILINWLNKTMDYLVMKMGRLNLAVNKISSFVLDHFVTLIYFKWC